MQVQRINNNNTTFGAKFTVEGSKLLNENAVAKLESIAKKIGKDTDSITIKLGKVKKEPYYYSYGGYTESGDTTSLYINATSNLNGEVDNMYLGLSRAVLDDITPAQYAVERIENYLKRLLRATKN